MKKINYFILVFFVLVLSQCTVFKKKVTKPITVKIVAPETYAVTNNKANVAKYITNHTQSEYQSKFMENFIAEGKATSSVTIDNDSQNPDFILEIKYVSITETDSLETIADVQSPNNGQQFLLNKVEASCEVIVLDAKTNKQVGASCTNFKSRQEKLKNNRDLAQLISGTNKDHKTYHEKLLDSNIALQLAGDVGRRVWVPITKRVHRSLK
jgi:hypothetical protein